jgi:dihydropteroate synthase
MSATDMIPRSAWHFRDRDHQPRELPLLMGIVNVTPDSFSDGGSFMDPQRAIDHALQLTADGADILDIGGESTRPGALAVPVDEELRRVVPVIERLRGQTDRLISVDTTKAAVAKQSLQAGADIVNDISGLTFDVEMPAVCADSGCGVIAMHIQGTPQTIRGMTMSSPPSAGFFRTACGSWKKPAFPASGLFSIRASASVRPPSTTSTCCRRFRI